MNADLLLRICVYLFHLRLLKPWNPKRFHETSDLSSRLWSLFVIKLVYSYLSRSKTPASTLKKSKPASLKVVKNGFHKMMMFQTEPSRSVLSLYPHHISRYNTSFRSNDTVISRPHTFVLSPTIGEIGALPYPLWIVLISNPIDSILCMPVSTMRADIWTELQ